ncbi:hypothetical protein [Paenibacillus sp. IHBB 10380]|uniref:hypothetical protein n=1 Tax=Paenibacillus sp. IHBB 10380 TaxID=1566358 RepID=UPI000A45819F|nr:hypothetical protein [Paenibacillus sp. IHBB 10380]
MHANEQILVKRTDCITYYASPGPAIEHCTSWIGGNAPDFFDDKADFIHKGDQTYYFYLSIVNPFTPNSMFSIFIPVDYEEYLENNMYPHCSSSSPLTLQHT